MYVGAHGHMKDNSGKGIEVIVVRRLSLSVVVTECRSNTSATFCPFLF